MGSLPDKALKHVLGCDVIVEYGPLPWGHRYHRQHGFEGAYVLIDRKVEAEPGLTTVDPEEARSHIPRLGKMAFISWWALGSAPRYMREVISGLVQNADCFAVAFADTVQGLDNVQAFHHWRQKFGGNVLWEEEVLPLPGRLMLGVRS